MEGPGPKAARGRFRLVLLYAMCQAVTCWHDLTNEDFHCWPSTASETSPATLGVCTGITLKWLEAPPEEIKAEKEFNVTFQLTLDDSFWQWAVTEGRGGNDLKTNFFDFAGITNGGDARSWCEDTLCPDVLTDVAKTTCCIWHVNVHSCPLDTTDFCGPWIKAEGQTYTHSDVLWGTSAQELWTNTVHGFYLPGTTQVIAHVKMAGFQMALFHNVKVLPKTECGNELCEDVDGETCATCPADCGACPLSAWQVALIVLAALVVLGSPIAFGVYWYWKQQKLLWDESWIIQFSDIKIAQGKDMGSFISKTTLDTKSTGTVGTGNISQSAQKRQLFCKVGLIDGKRVAIRELHFIEFNLNKEIRKEVKLVRSFDHINVCRFMGACLEAPNVCTLTEYCGKGSLGDVLLNDQVPLTWAFRFSFAQDIARGMRELHSKGVIHGRLKSNNCLVDDRWTVKVADYGLESLRPVDDKEQAVDRARQTRAYLPPEMVTAADTDAERPTASWDSYAFGVILVEIATRNGPFGDDDPDDLPDNWIPVLPSIDKEPEEERCPSPEGYLQLIRECWDQRPISRPNFDNIRRQLSIINPNKQSPVDLMMAMMERYSKHLEVIVADRTADLEQEKQRTDRLLYSMLPRAVADELRQGKSIGAETYDGCSIYFSDVVGFTSLSGRSTALQVIDLLNKLYVTFDSIIDKYDVYKVETIGDAYMVVSGVPQRNGSRHASFIAAMSLELVAACRIFIIPHLVDEPLKIRVGIHSGPVCAGVVGLKMPRYCLFGDTVNTASRMESNGIEYKIHVSDATYTLLQETGEFELECRGTIPIKGKGDMTTWWLTEQTTTQVEQ